MRTLAFLLLLVLTPLSASAQSQLLPGGGTDAPAQSAETTAPPAADQPAPPRQAEDVPVPEIDVSSPQATLAMFLQAMAHIRAEGPAEPGAWEAVAAAFGASSPQELDDSAHQLMRVFDRVGVPDPQALPNAEQAAEGPGEYLLFPRTSEHAWVWEQLQAVGRSPAEDAEIALARQENGTWTFSADTRQHIASLADSLGPLPPRATQADVLSDAAGRVMSLLGPVFQRTRLWQWMALLGCIFLGVTVGKGAAIGLRGMATRLRSRNWLVRATVFENLARPLHMTLIVLAIHTGLIAFVLNGDRSPLIEFVNDAATLGYILAIGWFCYNLVDLVDVIMRHFASRTQSRLDDALAPFVRTSLRIFLLVVFTLVVAQNVFGMDITGWLAGLGIAGLAISLAAQDSVKNLFGSLTVFFDRPFSVGDYISFGGSTGTVEAIGFRSCRIRLLSGALVTVPNMQFIDQEVENIAARPSIRREMDVTITYDTPPEKIEEAIRILREILTSEDVVESGRFDMENNPPRVHFTALNADSLNIKAYYWYQLANDPDRGWFSYLEHCELVNLKLFRAYGEAGIEFAFPTQTLYLAGDPERRLSVEVEQKRLEAGE
ncbi:MAG: mechanosensitive ion channel domain-containing protein [Phycisphaeraceae bacterium]